MEEQEQFQKLFDNYAEIALSVGVNVQPGQRMIVQAPVSAASFVHKLVEKAYERGVREVYVDYCDEALMRLKYLKQPEEGAGRVPDVESERVRRDGRKRRRIAAGVRS